MKRPGREYRLSPSSSLLLDLIRVLAAQAVVIGHSIGWLNIAPALRPPRAPYMQTAAVVVFFIMSGFLVSYTTEIKSSSGKYSFGEYFIDRFSRIYTTLVPSLFLIAVIDFVHIWLFPETYGYLGEYVKAFDFRTFLGNLLMLQDHPVLRWLSRLMSGINGGIGELVNITSFGSARPLWVVAIMWWVYMFYGWFVLSQNKLRKTGVWYWLVLSFLAIVPFYNFEGRGSGLALMWFFGVGVNFVRAQGFLSQCRKRGLMLGSLAMLLVGMGYAYVFTGSYSLGCAALLSISLLLAIEGLGRPGNSPPQRLWSFVKYCADFSFTLYLLHYSIIELLLPLVKDWNPWLSLAVFVITTNAISALVATVTEGRRHWVRARLRMVLLRLSSYDYSWR